MMLPNCSHALFGMTSIQGWGVHFVFTSQKLAQP
jgi:hypothetical protein